MTTSRLPDDEPCECCGAQPEHRECAVCGVEAQITDCPDLILPRPIAQSVFGLHLVCDDCAADEDRAGAALS